MSETFPDPGITDGHVADRAFALPELTTPQIDHYDDSRFGTIRPLSCLWYRGSNRVGKHLFWYTLGALGGVGDQSGLGCASTWTSGIPCLRIVPPTGVVLAVAAQVVIECPVRKRVIIIWLQELKRSAVNPGSTWGRPGV